MGVVTTAMADAKTEKKSGAAQLLQDLVIGGSVGAIAKTAMAPVERIKLLLQTMDSNPDIVSGKVERYKGVGDCFTRVRAEQGMAAFWRGNLVNCLRYAPQQGSALALNDALNNAFPRYDSKTQFWQSFATKLFSGGLAGGVANMICYPFDYARTRLASDVKKGKGQFNRHRRLHHDDGAPAGRRRPVHGLVGHGHGRVRVPCGSARLLQADPGPEPLQERQGHARRRLVVRRRHGRAYGRHAVQLPVRHGAPAHDAPVGEAEGRAPVLGLGGLLHEGAEERGPGGHVQGPGAGAVPWRRWLARRRRLRPHQAHLRAVSL